MVPCHTAFSRIYGLTTFFFNIVLFCLALESLTWEQASWWAGPLLAVCFCIRILGVTILGALHIGTGVGLRSLVVALPGDTFVTMST